MFIAFRADLTTAALKLGKILAQGSFRKVHWSNVVPLSGWARAVKCFAVAMDVVFIDAGSWSLHSLNNRHRASLVECWSRSFSCCLRHISTARATDSRKICSGQIAGDKIAFEGREVLISPRKTGAPGAIPTRDLPLRRRTLYAAELREHESRH